MDPVRPPRSSLTRRLLLPRFMRTTRRQDTGRPPKVPMEEEETTPIPSPRQDIPSKEPTMCPPLDMDKAK